MIQIKDLDTIVLNGCSAGGLAVFTWAETISSMIKAINPLTNVIAIPDSGFFLDYVSLRTSDNNYGLSIKALVDLVNNGTDLPNSKCLQSNPANPHYCLMAEHLVDYITVPLFIENSLYDSWQLYNILEIPCFIKP